MSSHFRDINNIMESALEESFLTQKTEPFPPGCISVDFMRKKGAFFWLGRGGVPFGLCYLSLSSPTKD